MSINQSSLNTAKMDVKGSIIKRNFQPAVLLCKLTRETGNPKGKTSENNLS